MWGGLQQWILVCYYVFGTTFQIRRFISLFCELYLPNLDANYSGSSRLRYRPHILAGFIPTCGFKFTRHSPSFHDHESSPFYCSRWL